MGSVVSSIGSFVGDIVEFAVDDIISPVVSAVGDVVGGMLDDPIGTIITVAKFIPGPHQPFMWAIDVAYNVVQKDYFGAVTAAVGAAYGNYIKPGVDAWISDTAGEIFGTTSNFGDIGGDLAAEMASEAAGFTQVQSALVAAAQGATTSVVNAAIRGDVKNIGDAALIGALTAGADKYIKGSEFVPDEDIDYDHDIEIDEVTYESSTNYLYDGLSKGTSEIRNAFRNLPKPVQDIILKTGGATAAAVVSGGKVKLEEILPTVLTQTAAKTYLLEGVVENLYGSDATESYKASRFAVLNKASNVILQAAWTGADASAAFEGVMTEDSYNQFSDALMRVIESEDISEFLKDYSTTNTEHHAAFRATEELRTEINDLVVEAKESPLEELHAGDWDEVPFTIDEVEYEIARYNENIATYNKRVEKFREDQKNSDVLQSRTVTRTGGGDDDQQTVYGPWVTAGPRNGNPVPPVGKTYEEYHDDSGTHQVQVGPEIHWRKHVLPLTKSAAEEYERLRSGVELEQYREDKAQIDKWLNQNSLYRDDYLVKTKRIEELKSEYTNSVSQLENSQERVIGSQIELDEKILPKLTAVIAPSVVESLLKGENFDEAFYIGAHQNPDGTWKNGADSSLTPHEHWLYSGRTNSFNQEYNDAQVDYVIRKNIIADSNIKLPQIVWSRHREEILKSDNPQEKYKELLDIATSEYINDIKIANNISTIEDIDMGVDDAIYATSVDLLDNLTREAEANDTEFARRPFYDKIPIPTYKKTYDGEGYESIDPRDMGTEEEKKQYDQEYLGYVRVWDKETETWKNVLGKVLVKKDEPGWQPEEFDPKLNKFVKYGPQPGDLSAPTYKTYKEERDAEHLRKLEATPEWAKIDYEALKERAVNLLNTQADNIISAFRSEDTYEDKVAKKLYNDWRAQGHDLKAMAKLIRKELERAGIDEEIDVTKPLDTLEDIVTLQETEAALGELIAFKNAVKEEGIKSEEMKDLYKRITDGFTVTEEDQDAFAILEPESNAFKIVENWKEEQTNSRERYIAELRDSDTAFKPFYSDSFGADVIPKVDLSARGTLFIPIRAIDGPLGYDNVKLREHIEDINNGVKLSPAKIAELDSLERSIYSVAEFVASQRGKFDDAASPMRTAYNAAVLAVDAGGEMLRAFTDVGRFFGAAPEGTDWSAAVDSLSKAATASYTEDYRAAQTEIHKNIKDAKGVWGTLSAAGESFAEHPGVFLADIVAKEIMQESVIIAASAGTGLAVSGALRAARLSNTLARNIGASTALTENNILQMIETAGGTSGESYRRIFSEVKAAGMSDAEADAYATQMALTIGTTAAIFELTAGGGKDIMDKFAERFAGGKQTAFRNSLEEWKRRAKAVGREGITEGFEEAAIQELLTSQAIYSATGKVPFDLEGDMTYAAIQGVLGGSGTAASIALFDIMGGSRPIDTGSPTGNALVNYNPIIRASFNDASQDPSSPDYDSAAQQAGEDNLKDAFGWNEFFADDGTLIDFTEDPEGAYSYNVATEVLNTAAPDKYTTPSEVEAAFIYADTELGVSELGASSFTPTEDQLLRHTGETPLDVPTIRAIVDDATFGTADARRIATEADYTLSSDELASFVEGLSAETSTDPTQIDNALISHIDDRQLNPYEVTELLGGVPATPEQIAALTGQGGPTFQEDQTRVVQDYRGEREVTIDEVVGELAAQGYTPPDAETDPEGAAAFDAEVAKYVGVSADPIQDETFGRIITDVDPRYILESEARQAYKDLGILDPVSADIDRFVGAGDETKLPTDIRSHLPIASYNLLTNTLGVPGQDITPNDITIIEQLIADQMATDAETGVETGVETDIETDTPTAEQLLYDVTGDNVIDQADLTMLQDVMAGTTSRADIATTSPFAATGIQGQLATQQAQQAQQAQQTQTAIQTAIANQTAADNQRRQEAADQQFMAQLLETTPVKVETPDPKKIEYVYDPFGDSIFAGPQRSLYEQASPYGTSAQPKFAAHGGLIEDETDTILRVLEGR